MRHIFRLLFPLLVTWLTLCDSKFVDPLVTDVLPSTRIVATVSMFKKMCENEAIITDVVLELVDVDKSAYGELKKKNLESQVKAINAASEFYEKTSTVDSQNLDKTLQGFGMLIGLKAHEDKLKEQFIDDAKKEIEKSISVSSDIMTNRNIRKTDFSECEEALKLIDDKNVDQVGTNESVAHLNSLRRQVKDLRATFTTINNYKTVYSDFLLLRAMGEKTKDAIEVITSLKSIFDNFDSIKVFDSIAPTLKNQVSKLNTEIAEFEKHATTLTSIESSLPVINRLSASNSRKSITRGLPNGPLDLKKLPTDLKTLWFVNNLVKGRDTESLQNFFSTISNTSSSLETAQVQRSKIASDQNIQNDFSDFSMKASELVVIGRKTAQNQNTESTLEAMVPCAQMMTKISVVPELKNAEEVASYVQNVVKLVQDFEKIADEITSNKDFPKLLNSLEKLMQVSNRIGNLPSLNETISSWEEIRNLNLLTAYDNIWKAVQKLHHSPFYLKKEDLPTSILTDALKSAKDANIFKAVECFPQTATSISDVINFGKKSGELKAETSKLKAVILVLTNTLVFSNSASEAAAMFQQTKSQKEIEFVCDLPENFTKKVTPFVLVGDFINDLTKLERSDTEIQVVTNPNDEVKIEIENIPGADFYNDDYRKTLSDAWNRVKRSFKLIAPVKTFKELVKLIGTILPEVKGVVVKDLNKLKHPISVVLFKNSDSKIKKAAESFEKVSALNLDFASYSSELTLKNDLVDTLSLMFPAKVSDAVGQESSFLVPVVVVVGILIAIVLIAVLICWWKKVLCFKEKKSTDDDIESQTVDENGNRISNKKKKGSKGDGKDSKENKGDSKAAKEGSKASKTVSKGSKGSKGSKYGSKMSKDAPERKSKSRKNLTWFGRLKRWISKKFVSRKTQQPVVPMFKHPDVRRKGKVYDFGKMPLKSTPEQRSRKDLSPAEQRMKDKLEKIRILLVKLREHAARVERDHKSYTRKEKFKFMGSIFIPAEPFIPKRAAVLPDNISLKSVRYDPEGNEWWEIGSDVDDIEMYSDFKIEDILSSTESEELVFSLQETQRDDSEKIVVSKKKFTLKEDEKPLLVDNVTAAVFVSSVNHATTQSGDSTTHIGVSEIPRDPATDSTPAVSSSLPTPPVSPAPSSVSSTSNIQSEFVAPASSNEQL